VIGRWVDAEEVAYVVAFLASPRSAAITDAAIACGGRRARRDPLLTPDDPGGRRVSGLRR
jgi:NAD(P)-dependent dehydrogenase (short-subunit alcohol dehydrogenase family)